MLRKLERDRKDARAKTGLREHNISQQRKCDNKRCSNGYQIYKLFNRSVGETILTMANGYVDDVLVNVVKV